MIKDSLYPEKSVFKKALPSYFNTILSEFTEGAQCLHNNPAGDPKDLKIPEQVGLIKRSQTRRWRSHVNLSCLQNISNIYQYFEENTLETENGDEIGSKNV